MSESSHPVVSVRGLAEVVLNCHDLAAMLTFYRDLLGLSVISPHERKNPIFLRAGDSGEGLPSLVVLVQMQGELAPFTKPRTLHHLALTIPSDTFDATMTALTERGFTVRTGQHPVLPSRTMYIDDPEGNEVELITPA